MVACCCNIFTQADDNPWVPVSIINQVDELGH